MKSELVDNTMIFALSAEKRSEENRDEAHHRTAADDPPVYFLTGNKLTENERRRRHQRGLLEEIRHHLALLLVKPLHNSSIRAGAVRVKQYANSVPRHPQQYECAHTK